MDPAPFNGSGDASAWLKAFEERSKKKSPSWKTKRLEKLVEGEARNWWYTINMDHWDQAREKFMAYWVNGLRGDSYRVKCGEIDAKAPRAPVSVNWISITRPTASEPASTQPAPPPKPEPSSSHPLFSVLVNAYSMDPRGIYAKAFTEFSRADDKEKMFHVLWDAAFEAGRQVGISDGPRTREGEDEENQYFCGHIRPRPTANIHIHVRANVVFHFYSSNGHISADKQAAEHVNDLMKSLEGYFAEDEAEEDTLTPTRTPAAPSNAKQDIKLDWAEEANSLPHATLFPVSSQPPRDLTILRSQDSYTHPFRTLHRRTQRTRKTQHKNIFSAQSPTTTSTGSTTTHVPPSRHGPGPGPVITCRHPAGIGYGKPAHYEAE
ncbi:hypothetical protein K435DRAFT_874118 [Dendrothele bispora CBS 962.96]|uniref:Uncharacterized protein n=1 Tax=Dendrothele bispora (strain CBS 962.96) TaxID=1314807 RepID=A0A4S8KXF7_DENBC|nr:hypothetical protein K435DRAFT_874118 [Dendrothele bispora CBS 962.96]